MISFKYFSCFVPHRDYKEHHTDTTVKFEVSLSAENLAKAEQEGLYKKFNLESSIPISNMVRRYFCLEHKCVLSTYYTLFYCKWGEIYRIRAF